MTSAINTNGINVNYPVPGINNSSQGFRDNFAAIKTDLNVAATEITDLQNNAVLKQALTGTTLNNDMANTLISNAVTRGFRASTFNLGNAISGTLIINAGLGDVQTGTINGNTTIQFTGWAPRGTQSNVEVQLNIANNLAVIALPSQVNINGTSGIETIENYANVSGIPTLTIPYDVNRLDYRFSTLDCGDSITIEPYNQPRQSTQLKQRTPSPVGEQGDVVGTFSMDPATSIAFATCTATNGTYDFITCDSTLGFYLDMPIVFTGITFGGILGGGTYYVRSILSSTTFTISTVPGTYAGPSQLTNLITATGTMYVSPISYLYASTGAYDGTVMNKYASNTNEVITTVTGTNTSSSGNTITVSSTSGFVVGYPVAFSGTLYNTSATQTYLTANTITVSTTANMIVGGRILFAATSGAVFGGLAPSTAYYITNIYPGNSNIKVSTTFGGNNVSLSNDTGLCSVDYNVIMGGLTPSTDYYVQSIANGTAFTVCANNPGGAPVALINENGSMNVTTVTDYTVTLTSSTGNITNNSPITFSGNVFGGVSTNTIYYVANITNGTDISLSSTLYNGLSGQKLPLTTANGNMTVEITTGTEIWKSVPLKPFGSAEDGSAISGDLVVYGNANVFGTTTVTTLNAGTVTGNIAATNITVSNVASFSNSQIKISGGSGGYYLQTDGTGNLTWASGTASTTTAAGGANTQIQFNDASVIQGNTGFTFNKTTGAMAIPGILTVASNLSAVGNAVVGNLTTAGNIVANNYTTTAGSVTAPLYKNGTSNIAITSGGNITMYVAGNATARLTATSTGANITGTLSTSGNAIVGNISATNGVFAGALSGITTITANGNVSASNLISSTYVVSGVTNSIIANGTVQGNATVLANGFNVVSTVSSSNYGVILPAPISANATVGMRVMVRNNGAVPLYVYPPINAQINNLGANIAYQQNATSTNEFFCTGNLVWYSLN
jgi:hypothetical protein